MFDPSEFIGDFWFGYVTRHCRTDYMQGAPLIERLNPLRYEIGFGAKRPCRVVWNRKAWMQRTWSNFSLAALEAPLVGISAREAASVIGLRRIRLSRAKGWRLPEGAVNVARPGKWGNPFVVGKDGTRLQCVAMFLQLARGFIDLGGRVSVDEQLTLYRRIRRSIGELKGRDLACWCALDGEPCHGDVLLHLANGGGYLEPIANREIELPRVRLGMTAADLERARRKRHREAA